MPETVTKEFVRTLAEASGIHIPEERLDLVLRQYESFRQTLEKINSLSLARETEPAIVYTLPSQPPATSDSGEPSGVGR